MVTASKMRPLHHIPCTSKQSNPEVEEELFIVTSTLLLFDAFTKSHFCFDLHKNKVPPRLYCKNSILSYFRLNHVSDVSKVSF